MVIIDAGHGGIGLDQKIMWMAMNISKYEDLKILLTNNEYQFIFHCQFSFEIIFRWS